jgi:hypothetical protein
MQVMSSLSKSSLFKPNVAVYTISLKIREQFTYLSDAVAKFPVQPVGADVFAAAAALLSEHFKMPNLATK